MRTICRSLFFVLFICLPSIAWSGELAADIVSQVSSKKPNELVKVWIKLPRVNDAFQFKASVNAQAATRAGRYQIAVSRLRQNNTNAQQALVQRLKEMESNNLAANIKPHWIVNIVEAEVAVGELSGLADRSDIQMIYAVPKIESIMPDKVDPAPALSTGVEGNLTYIKADSAWAAGYTGAGRVICSFDTGVDGAHPALINNWKGHDGDSGAAWFDPLNQELFPHTIPGISTDHGTNAMGILVGHDDATGDTIGVALDAKWISAAVIDIPGTSIIDAFEWAADPDGDPNSIDDVPDVINHSWGVRDIGCINIFYDLIDNLEALGIVNIFAAGNEGSAAATIRNPANRADDSLDCFAVGSINTSTTPPSVSFSSSRGPSDCNGTIKPNVTAPGSGIRTSSPNGNYGYFSGTSAATPHVAGLVALLRQKNPNATVDEIKEAILTTANDFGYTLPDNNFGWGVIDCMAALNALSPANVDPNIRVYAFDHDPIAPGDTVAGAVVLQNIGADVFGVSASITGSDPSLIVLNGSAYFGTIYEGDTVRSVDIIRVVVSDTITEGSVLSLDFDIMGDTGYYSQPAKLFFVVEPANKRMFVTHNIGKTEFTVSNFGTYGLGTNSFFPAGGVGFTFEGGANDLYEGGLIIGTDADHVSDGVRNAIGEPDGDFRVLPGGNIELMEPGETASQETFSRFSDERAENPLGLEIVQQSYAFDISSYDDFVILRYILKNSTSSQMAGVYLGFYLDWDIVAFSANAGGWEASDGFAWMAYNNGLALSNFRGVKVVGGTTTTALTARADSLVRYPDNGSTEHDGFTEQEKYSSLADGFGSGSTYMNTRLDLLQLVSAGPLTIDPGQVDTIAFALLAGNSLADITAAAEAAQFAYDCLITGADSGQLTVESILPQPGKEQDILITQKPFQIQFNQPVQYNTLTDNVSFRSFKGDNFPNLIYDPRYYLLFVDNSSDYLMPLDTIEMILERGILDTVGYPLDRRYVDTFYTGAAVFPGDANNDGVVDERDILPMGLYWGNEGPQRADSADISWGMKPAHVFVPGSRWTPLASVYADADGLGSVDALDICAVTENWAQTHPAAHTGDNSLVDIAVALKRFEKNVPRQMYAALIDCPESEGKENVMKMFESLLGEPDENLPMTYQLYQNYPNPFNPYTTINFYLPQGGRVTLSIYNIMGQKVAVLLDGYLERGHGKTIWDGVDQSGKPVATGIYFYRLESDQTSITKRMLLLK